MITRLAILGSTGSIGQTCLQIAGRQRDRFEVTALAAGTQWPLLADQIRVFKPAVVSVATEDAAQCLRQELRSAPERNWLPTIWVGDEGLLAVATHEDANLVVNGLTGGIGVEATVAAIQAGKDVALANKEALVIAGDIVTREAKENRVRLLPVDSEISAIWQCLDAGRRSAEIRRVLLTASGGPFSDTPPEELAEITPSQALAHPTWVMGQKVTIDSATLMNKGFELIEIMWLFNTPLRKIEVVVHHQSVIHSLIEYIDGSVMAQMGVPDMTLPIQYALTYPDRVQTQAEQLDLPAIGSLTFAKPDAKSFHALDLARHAAELGGTMPAVLSGADETAVELFMKSRIRFVDIVPLVERTMSEHTATRDPSLADVLDAERWARTTATSLAAEIG